ncbi:MAG: LysR family transcriptional regulator [Pseudomonadota bacterium]
MIDLRDMQILTSLDRHRHFARAAEDCGISQPAFSARIRNLELELGVQLVNRGNRFQGFTAEGEIVLGWGLRMLADLDGLRQDISAATGALTGRIRIGTVPTALAFAATLPALLRADHPDLLIEIHSTNATEIRRGLQNATYAAGLSYLEGSNAQIAETPLYEEAYRLLAPEALLQGRTELTWAEAAALPLCLLTRDMQNRRILETFFAEEGAAPNTVMETNALTAAWTQLQTGLMATILPEKFVAAAAQLPGITTATLTPTKSRPIGLLLPVREPEPALHALLKRTLRAPQ